MSDQPTLFEMPRQHRSKSETNRLHAAAVFLRKHGYAVYRAGAFHKVNGSMRTARELMQMATLQGFEP
jgi:hypothetical protein